MKIKQNIASDAHAPDKSETIRVSQRPIIQNDRAEKSHSGALSALKLLRARLTQGSESSRPQRKNVILRQRMADQLPAVSPLVPTLSFGGCAGSKPSRSSYGDSSELNELPPIFQLSHVPYVSQGMEEMGCWYACARMVGHSVEAGPRLGLPELYDPQYGHNRLDPGHAEQFIENEGLSKIELPDSREFSHEELGALLYRHGPIIFGWRVPEGNWHMSVLTGVCKYTGRVIFHDPQRGPDQDMPLSYFNERLAWRVPHAMLHG